MLEAYFTPLSPALFESGAEPLPSDTLGRSIQAYVAEGRFPSFEGARMAIIGIGEERGSISNGGCAGGADLIREKLFRLKQHQQPVTLIDLGNLRPGLTAADSYAAISTVVSELVAERIIVVVLGGSQDLTYGHYCGYKKLEQIINIVSLDSRFDVGTPDDPLNSDTFLGKIIMEQPNYLFNFSNLGYQTYFTGSEGVNLMKKLYFDTYRLGQVQQDIQEAEPIVRNADLLTVDLSAVRASDAPGNRNASPNGFYGEELCQILYYAGLSDKLSGLGLYEYNPLLDTENRSAHLYAQALWYFIEGVGQRKMDMPVNNPNQYITYRVALEELEQEITFIKSMRSDRWWIKLPTEGSRNRYMSQHLLPCSYRDYQMACNNEVPERWWNALHRMV